MLDGEPATGSLQPEAYFIQQTPRPDVNALRAIETTVGSVMIGGFPYRPCL